MTYTTASRNLRRTALLVLSLSFIGARAPSVSGLRDGSQRGIGENAGEMVQWIEAKHPWVRVSRQRGYLL